MKRCPFCGALLAATLVDAIVNPSRPESCPKVDQLNRGLKRFDEELRAFAREVAEAFRKAGLTP